MLKNYQDQVQSLIRFGDLVIAVVAFLIAYQLRSSPLFFPPNDIIPIPSLLWVLAASISLHLLVFPMFGFYQSLRRRTIVEVVTMIIKAFIIEFFVLGSLVFFLQAKDTSRTFFGLFLVFNYGLLLVERLGARTLLSAVRRRGYNFRQVVVVGTGENAKRVIRTLQANRHWGFVIAAVLRERTLPGDAPLLSDKDQEVEGVTVFGDVHDLEKLTQERTIDEVYFAPERLDSNQVSNEVALCETLGIPARFSLSLFDLPHSKLSYSTMDRIPLITYYTTWRTPAEAVLKRLMDVAISLVGLWITAFLFPWISYRIRKESPGPLIFKQWRVGENGRYFKCYKFRTMMVDADAKKAELQKNNLMQGPMFKIENDPRVFSFGAFLRKTSLDELPQFFNILRGDMSVVGTRPPTPDEVKQYQTYYRRRLSIRPGLTGLWQVSGRNRISRFEDVLALDLKYIDNWSLWLDVKIIVRTIWVTLFRRGAF